MREFFLILFSFPLFSFLCVKQRCVIAHTRSTSVCNHNHNKKWYIPPWHIALCLCVRVCAYVRTNHTMEAFTVRGWRELLSPTAIKAYRRHGVLVAHNCFEGDVLRQLSEACRAAAIARGANVFSAVDAESGAPIGLDSKPRPESSEAGPHSSLSPDVAPFQTVHEQNSGRTHRAAKPHVTLKNQRLVDRAYRRMTRTRQRHGRLNTISEGEVHGGTPSEARLHGVTQKYDDAQPGASHSGYGTMEPESRRDSHVNEALEYLQNWPKSWFVLWSESEALRRLLFDPRRGLIGKRAGEAASTLSGEIVTRLFADHISEPLPFTNATPFFFGGLTANYHHENALSVCIGLSDTGDGGTAAAVDCEESPCLRGFSRAVVPGSHRVVWQLSDHGRDLERFAASGVFDMGNSIRSIPALRELPIVHIPPLDPGTALFLNQYVFVAGLPGMEGGHPTPYTSPFHRPPRVPREYALSLLPDRCAFDGRRNSWSSGDSHGQLYKYERGQLLTDDNAFPVLWRALDVE